MEFLLVYRTTWKLLVPAVINGHSFVLSLVHSFVRSFARSVVQKMTAVPTGKKVWLDVWSGMLHILDVAYLCTTQKLS